MSAGHAGDALRALVIHPGFLGDTVFLGPAVRALKARWPGGRVAVCVTPRGADVARLLPGCDDVFVYDKRGADRGPRALWAMARRLRAWRPDLALVPHPSLRAGALAWGSRATRRIGYARFSTERLRIDRSRPFVDRTLELAERAGARGDPALALSAPSGAAQAYAARVLADVAPPVVGVVPGAEWATKRWGSERYAALVTELAAGGANVLLLGGPADRERAGRIAARTSVPVRDATGNTVAEAIALLARCDLVVGGDTGLVHCARALGRPTLVLFGPTDPARHRFTEREAVLALGIDCQPCHDHGPARCPLGHHDCMRRLAVADVAARARRLLDAVGA